MGTPKGTSLSCTTMPSLSQQVVLCLSIRTSRNHHRICRVFNQLAQRNRSRNQIPRRESHNIRVCKTTLNSINSSRTDSPPLTSQNIILAVWVVGESIDNTRQESTKLNAVIAQQQYINIKCLLTNSKSHSETNPQIRNQVSCVVGRSKLNTHLQWRCSMAAANFICIYALPAAESEPIWG